MKQKTNIYQIVTDRILEKLEAGEIPWRKLWEGGEARNWQTGRPYSGINRLLLDGGEYATFNQVKNAGGSVKKGAKSHLVTFWKVCEYAKPGATPNEDGELEGDGKKRFYMRYYRVFSIADCEGIESKLEPTEAREIEPIKAAMAIVEGYQGKPTIEHKGSRAFYRPRTDGVNMPPINSFFTPEAYHSVLFHELVHSTGAGHRLAREGIIDIASFGSDRYSKEELVAEIGAAMLCGVAGIEDATIENSAAYIQSWSKRLKSDPKLIITAASQAQKAADYIRGIIPAY